MLPEVRRNQPRQHPDGGRFTRSVGPQEAEETAPWNHQVETVHGGLGVVNFCKPRTTMAGGRHPLQCTRAIPPGGAACASDEVQRGGHAALPGAVRKGHAGGAPGVSGVPAHSLRRSEVHPPMEPRGQTVARHRRHPPRPARPPRRAPAKTAPWTSAKPPSRLGQPHHRRLHGHVDALGRLSIIRNANLRSRAKASASLTRSMISAESLPILRSSRTVGRDPDP